MAVPGFFPQQVQGATIGSTVTGAGLGSSLQYLSLSAWTCGSGGEVELKGRGGGTDIFLISLATSSGNTPTVGVTVQAPSFLVQNAYSGLVVAGYDETAPDGVRYQSLLENNFLVAVDLIAQTIAVYVNDTAIPPTYLRWISPGSADNTALDWTLTIPGDVSVGDVWVSPMFTDFSVVANRRQFINADLSAVTLPTNGHVAVSGTPVIFLHTTAGGTADGFMANNGTGPAWGLRSGSLTLAPLANLAATNPCMSVIGTSTPRDTVTDAELLFSDTGGFYDLTNPDVRRLFVTGSVTPAWMGPDGSLPFSGRVPQIYLTLPNQSSPASDFAQNAGSGGAFAIEGVG